MTADAHLVALLALPRLGPRRLDQLLEEFGEPQAAWRAVLGGQLDGVSLHATGRQRRGLIEQWREAASGIDVAALVDDHIRAGVRILTPEHPDWPAAFAEDPEPPPLAFVRGDPALLSSVAVAIVGTRRCTAAGAAIARDMARDLAAAGVGVISGLALGIDGAAHQGCLDGGGPAIGVVATGLDTVYPRRHARLWERVATTGVLVSEAPLGRAAERWRFPARNRLIAGLASVVVVVESRRHGGSMLTVDAAAERGVDVMAVPGPVRSAPSDGPNQLLHDGCGVARDATDVLTALGSRVPHQAPCAGGGEPGTEGAGAASDPVADAISWPASSLDDIVAATGLPFTEVAARLATLELAGVVERVADGYQRTTRAP